MKKSLQLFLIPLFGLIIACSSNSSEDNTDDDPIDSTGNPKLEHPANFQTTGSSANDFLANTNFDRLLVEIAYVQGFRPTQTTLNNFVAFLEQYTFKESVELRFTPLPSPNEQDLDIDEVEDLEIENRTAYNDDNTLAVYIYFADAPSDDDDLEEGLVTLGAVYFNTSMIIYETTVRLLANSNSDISITDAETATLNHEFGHLFGLVDLGTEQVNPHEDPNAPNHCSEIGCLMRAELQLGAKNMGVLNKIKSAKEPACAISGTSILRILKEQKSKGNKADVPSLGMECELDLENNGGRSQIST